jgi:hypothetical protein
MNRRLSALNFDDLPAVEKLQRITLEKIRIGMTQHYAKVLLLEPQISLNEHAQHIADRFMFQLEGYLWGKNDKREDKRTETKTADVSWPSTWWEHWKEQHAPDWFKKRWPVKYSGVKYDTEIIHHTTIHETRICPHLSIDSRNHHLEFLV